MAKKTIKRHKKTISISRKKDEENFRHFRTELHHFSLAQLKIVFLLTIFDAGLLRKRVVYNISTSKITSSLIINYPEFKSKTSA